MESWSNMKNIEILKDIKELIDCEDTKFIPVEEVDMIYINYNASVNDLSEAYQKAKKIAKQFDTETVFHFNGHDILLNKDTTIEDVESQYSKSHEIHYKLYVENEFKKATKNLAMKNAKRKLKEVSRLLNDVNGFRKYVENYELNELSKALYNTYKSTQPDEYLDGMVEDAKVSIQQEEGKTLRKIKGEKQICNF